MRTNSIASGQDGCDAQAHAGGLVLSLDMHAIGGIGTNPPRCDYNPSTGELVGANGVPVAGWTNLPLNVL